MFSVASSIFNKIYVLAAALQKNSSSGSHWLRPLTKPFQKVATSLYLFETLQKLKANFVLATF
jgi:hypothetical protein